MIDSWAIDRNTNITIENVVFNLLHQDLWKHSGNPAAVPSALFDWGYWNSKFSDPTLGKPTAIAELVLSGEISWPESVIALLAKRGREINGQIEKPLVSLAKVFSKIITSGANPYLTKESFKKIRDLNGYGDITDKFCDELNSTPSANSDGKYADIWLNALVGANFLFKRDRSDKFELCPSQTICYFFEFLAKYGEQISPCPDKHKTDDYRQYMESLETGLFEILDLADQTRLRPLLPNLLRIKMKNQVVKTKKTCSYQLITYGAPGTGKSFKIKNETTGQKVFRTTFHPDSDYATFVGAYKPVMNEVERTVLVGKKLEMADVGSVKEELKKESVISYEFVEQVFTKAYIEAWGCQKAAKADEEPKRVYLVIEEINRGNCAQIFGDLFQLLDRNGNGFSEYPIRPDSDFGKHIATALGKREGTFDEDRKSRIKALYPEVEEGVDIVDEVLSGRCLLLPDNLLIRATMNTSDQSLFPMDSAFKRRWDWDYVPIEDHPEENWEIEIDSSTHYKWWDFLNAINTEIFKATSSEDKQLGYFFVQAKGGKTDLDTFVNKVVFYLWNSVFKDCYTDCEFMKKDTEKDSYFIFTTFFKSGKPDAEQAKGFLGNLEGVKSVEAKEDETAKAEAKAQADGEGASDDDGQSAGNG